MKGRFGHDDTIYNYMYGVGSLSSIYTAYIKVKKISGSRTQSASPAYIKPHVIEFLQIETLFNHFYLVMELQDGDASELALLDEFTQARGLFDVGDNIGRPLLGACLLRSNNP
ncbi:unnamed protein product [Fusarium graminearum]|nr:unnamed protein product [Fusarium graminearum]